MTTRKWGNEFQINTLTGGTQDQSSVTALSDGGFIVVWCDNNPAVAEVKMQRFDAEGNPVGPELLPAEDTIGFAGSDPDVIQLLDGSLLVSSTRFIGGSSDAEGQVVDLSGVSIRDAFLSGAASAQDSVQFAASRFGGYAGVYRDSSSGGSDIRLDIFDSAGTRTVNDLIVNTNPGTLASFQGSPTIDIGYQGDIAVAWNDGAAVKARLLTGGGSNKTAEFFAAIVPSGATPQNLEVTWISRTTFAITWVQDTISPDPAGFRDDIFYAIFDTNGQTISAPRVANTATTWNQEEPDIVALPGGGFAIAWWSIADAVEEHGDQSFAAIKLQVFNPLGERRGDEITVNTTTFDSQQNPSLAALADGRIVVTWDDPGTGDVMAQIIDPRDGMITGSAAAEVLYGHDIVNDEINGLQGADTLFGLGGADALYGGEGADTGNGGRGDDVIYGGAGADMLNGNQGDDLLFGGKEGDTLNGGKGDDEYNGGTGNDIIFDAEGDDVINGGADIDKVDYFYARAGLTTSLDGTLTATGAAAGDTYISVENLAGTNFADILRGNAASNTIFGRSGDDRILGAGGADTLLGNAGSDTFAYENVSESAPAARDQITDFTVIAGNGTTFADRIDLSAIDAIAGGGNNAFTFIGTAAFTAAGQVRVTASGASDTLVEMNTSGTSGAEMAILLKGILPTAIFDEDFVL